MEKRRNRPWYSDYPQLIERLTSVRERFNQRCAALGQEPNRVLEEWRPGIVAIAVHESNWQEGIYVERGRTRELAMHVFEEGIGIPGPHLDIESILEEHKRQVIGLKRKKVGINEIAAHNLSVAHLAIGRISNDLVMRYLAGALNLVHALHELLNYVRQHDESQSERLAALSAIMDAFEAIRLSLETSETELSQPMSGGIRTESELVHGLQEIADLDQFYPNIIEYIYFIHKILMMGIEGPGYCGVFRKQSVNVGNPDLLFPPPCALPQRMLEFSDGFHIWNPTPNDYDANRSLRETIQVYEAGRKNFLEKKASKQLNLPTPKQVAVLEGVWDTLAQFISTSATQKPPDQILRAARVSHQFVCIHPYRDGNGRVSRLLMNLALYPEHPPVYLKADKKGRHRYFQALRRADRGDLNPLASLIAVNLIEIYEKILRGLGADRDAE